MNEAPTYEATFYGGPRDHPDGTVRAIPMVKHPKTYEWVEPEHIVTSGIGGPVTGHYVRMTNEPLPKYWWYPGPD